LFPQFNSTIGLLDNKGTILHTTGAQQYAGENIFGSKFQSVLRLCYILLNQRIF
jgi:hypothetical protein